MKRVLDIVLVVLVCGLGWVVYQQLVRPIRFDKVRVVREKIVYEKLMGIREAEQQFFKQNNRFTANLDSLTAFAKRQLTKAGSAPEADFDDNFGKIPFSQEKDFILEAGSNTTVLGIKQPWFECRAPYKEFLHDLHRQELINLIHEKKLQDKYPGLKIGSETNKD